MSVCSYLGGHAETIFVPPDTRIILQPMGVVDVGDQKLQLDSHGKEEYQKRHLQPHVHTRPLTRSSTHSLAYSTTNHSHQRQHPLTHSPSSLTRSYIQPSTHSLTNSCKSHYIAEQSVKITYSHYVEFFVLCKVCRNVVLSQLSYRSPTTKDSTSE